MLYCLGEVKWLFLSLKNGDSDVTEVSLVFEQLLYDVYEVFGWFVWIRFARGFEDFSTHKNLAPLACK